MYEIVKIDGEYYQLVDCLFSESCEQCALRKTFCMLDKRNHVTPKKMEWFDANFNPLTVPVDCVRKTKIQEKKYYRFKKLDALYVDILLSKRGQET